MDSENLIYHYTTFSALNGILCKEGIRLCNSKEMNDDEEVFYFINKLEESIIQQFYEQNKNDNIEKVIKIFAEQKAKRENNTSYLFSLSEWEDDASQWERYGLKGKGVAIAFDRDILTKITKEHHLTIGPVNYQKDISNNDFTKDIINAIENNYSFEKIDLIFDDVWKRAIAFKHPSFASEKETRLSTEPIYNHKKYADLSVEYISTPTQIKKVLIYDWKKDCIKYNIPFNKLIKEIIIGNNSPQTIADLQDWLINNDLECLSHNIIKSTSSLR